MATSNHTRTWGIVLLIFGVCVLFLADGQIPDRSSLTEITGQLRSLEKTTSKGGGLGSVRFSLSSDPRHFSYHSSAGNIDEVWNSLNRACNAVIGVLIDPKDSHSPPGDNRSFFAILEIRVGEETICSYSQVVDSLRTNSFIGRLLGYGSLALGTLLLVARLIRRR